MKFDPLVAKIIVVKNFDHFTTSDVRAAYIALKSDPSLEPVKLRRQIYAELLKLVKKGWLNKIASNKKGFTRFNKTNSFDIEVVGTLAGCIAHNVYSEDDEKKNRLLAKLNHYKAELLLNIGESDAYKELYEEFPELVTEIQPKYNNARDNNTKILGKIRAIEGLLEQDKEVENL